MKLLFTCQNLAFDIDYTKEKINKKQKKLKLQKIKYYLKISESDNCS